jgi:hypothetical protein
LVVGHAVKGFVNDGQRNATEFPGVGALVAVVDRHRKKGKNFGTEKLLGVK